MNLFREYTTSLYREINFFPQNFFGHAISDLGNHGIEHDINLGKVAWFHYKTVAQKNTGVSQKNKNKNSVKKRLTKCFGGSDPMNWSIDILLTLICAT